MSTGGDVRRIREQLGLDGSLPEQYGRWLLNIAQGDLGISWQNRLPVVERMADRIFMSLELGILSVALACVMGTTLGVIAAVRRDTWVDYVLRSVSMGFQAMPGFWVALMAIVLLVSFFGWIPSIYYAHIWDDPLRNLSVLWLPALIVGSRSSAEILRMTRSSVLEVMDSEFVKLARAKGVGTQSVVWKHVLRNALIQPITISTLLLAGLLNGTLVAEAVFAWPGLGRAMLEAVRANDFPVMMGGVLFFVIASSLESRSIIPLPLSDGVAVFAGRLGVDQSWDMYVPRPPIDNFSLDHEFVPVAGRTLDESDPGRERRRMIEHFEGNYRFKCYLERTLNHPRGHERVERYLTWMCREWNAGLPAERRLERVALSVDTRTTLAGGRPPRHILLLDHTCEAADP